MSAEIRLAADLTLPLDAVTETFAVLGMRGAGKTETVTVLVEEFRAADLPCVVLDPKGDLWGLRTSRDGKGPGVSLYVLGGEHADLPLEPSAGRVVADFVVEGGASCVLDFSAMSKTQMRTFVADFAEQFYRAKNRADRRHPHHVVIDEADLLIPQQAYAGQERLLGAMSDLVLRGRNRGIGASVVTQRPARVSKDVLTQAGTLIALRTIGERDRKAVMEWIAERADEGGRKLEFLGELPRLADGEAWIWSPAAFRLFRRMQVRRRRTFDSSRTPRVGEARPTPTARSAVDLAALERAMAETVERTRQADPAALRRRIQELEHQLESRPAVINERVVTVLPAAIEGDSLAVADGLDKLRNELAAAAERLQDGATRLRAAVQHARQEILQDAQQAETRKATPPRARAMPADRAPSNGAHESSAISAYARHLLETVARRRPLRPTRSQLAVLAGRSTSSSAFHAAMAELLRAELLAVAGGQYILTPDGEREAGEPAPVGPLLDVWRRALPDYERLLLDALLEHGGVGTRDALAGWTGRSMSSSAFHAALATLAKQGLIETGGGRVAVTELLSSEGAR